MRASFPVFRIPGVDGLSHLPKWVSWGGKTESGKENTITRSSTLGSEHGGNEEAMARKNEGEGGSSSNKTKMSIGDIWLNICSGTRRRLEVFFCFCLNRHGTIRSGRCWIKPKCGSHNNIKTHEYHSFQPITSSIVDDESNSQNSQEEDNTLKWIE